MNNKNRPPIQYTKLTRDDIATHKDCYVYLLFRDVKRSQLSEKGEELHKAMQLFYNTFK